MPKTQPGMNQITAKGLSIWKMDYYLIAAANLPVQPKYLAPEAQVINVSWRTWNKGIIFHRWQMNVLYQRYIINSFGQEADNLRQRIRVITEAIVWSLVISCRPWFLWLRHYKYKGLQQFSRTRVPQAWGSPSSGFFPIVCASASVWLLLNGILGWKWTLTEGWVRWNIDNHFCFFSSPNGMTHGNSHFLLPASTWLHYRQTAGDWICFWGWVTTLFLSHSARGKGVWGGQHNVKEGLEISLL